VTNATATVTEEDKLWSKYDWSVDTKTGATLRQNIARALELSHSRYTKLKKLTKEQQDEKDTIELGILSIMQMHYNETGTELAKNWKDNFTDIYTLHHQEYMKLIDSDIIETGQENKEATEDVESDDDDEVSDEDDSDYVETNKRRERFSLFEDEEEIDDPGTQNALANELGHEKIVGYESQDVVATNNEKNE